MSSVSHLTSAQNNPYNKVAYFGVAYFDPLDIHHFRGRKRPLVHSCTSRGIWLIVDAQENWKIFTVENRGVGYACCEILC